MIDTSDIAAAVKSLDLIGFNIHFDPSSKEWSVWTRERNSDGWSRSGKEASLELALSQCIGEAEYDAEIEALL